MDKDKLLLLKEECDEFSDNIEAWIETDDDRMIEEKLSDISRLIKQIE
jgi:hypothetical protein